MQTLYARLREIRSGQTPIARGYAEVAALLEDHADLLGKLSDFLPAARTQPALCGYEQFHGLKRGSATIAQVPGSALLPSCRLLFHLRSDCTRRAGRRLLSGA